MRGLDFLVRWLPENILSCYMANNPAFYFDGLYPFQGRVIKIVNQADTNFYLTCGTAASRGYLNHRFSDDLDYFVNDDDRFSLWEEGKIQALTRQWKCDVLQKKNVLHGLIDRSGY